MPSLALSDRLIWFAHCPKAGGTSVEQAMVAVWGDRVGHVDWGWQRRRRRGGWRHMARTSPQHMIWPEVLATLPRRPDATFALVRDPVARLQSEQGWQRDGRSGTFLGRSLARLPFAVWLRLMLALAARDARAFDNHLRPQSDFIPREATIFRLEDGTEAPARWLGRMTDGPAPPIAHALRSGRRNRPVSEDCRRRIAAAYAVDYERFGYDALRGRAPSDLLDWLARAAAPVLSALDRRGLL